MSILSFLRGRTHLLLWAAGCTAVPLLVLGGGCSAATGTNGFENGGGTPGSGGGTGGVQFTSGAGAGILEHEPPCNPTDMDADVDGDGWTPAQGDCNDCTAAMNPGALDYPGNGIDEDCNGTPDDDPKDCDTGLLLESDDPFEGAKAIGICKMAQGDSWGLLNAVYVTSGLQPLLTAPPQKLGYGILPGFGPQVTPQEGMSMLALSSGAARRPGDPGYKSPEGFVKGYQSPPPEGYPKESPSCPDVTTGKPQDSAGLLINIRTPTNAKSLKFNLNFYTFEFPVYICSKFNDFFVANMSPIPSGNTDGNISFDSQGNTISVNAGFLQVCKAQTTHGKKFTCPLGTEELGGTGFDVMNNSAATGWLETVAPIDNPGDDISLLFTIWDSGDGRLDSTVLLDNFHFDAVEGETHTTPVPPK